MTLGEKISALRRQRGLSQKQLAEMLLISPQAVSRWEQDENMPDVDNIVQLSKIFEVSTDYLLKNGEVLVQSNEDEAPQEAPHNENGSKSEGKIHRMRREGNYELEFDLELGTKSSRSWRQNFIIRNIYNIALVAYLVMGFGWGLWHPGWLVFLAAGAVRGLSIYAIAALVFMTAGIWLGIWSMAWIAFPIAWLVDTLLTDYRRGKKRR